MITNISFITTHFFDFDWTSLLVQNIVNFTETERIKEILIINQDRSLESHSILKKLDVLVRVVEYPKSEKHFEYRGHDHAMVLNRAIHDVEGDYICIFDSDAHPINYSWLNVCDEIFEFYDAILALEPGSVMLTHPCFMMIKKEALINPIYFDENLFTKKVDTGRLIGKQLIKNNQRVYFASPTRAFNGLWGYFYLNLIYHHKHATFTGAEDTRISKQVTWENNFFKNYVIQKHRYDLTFSNFLKYKIIFRLNILFH